MPDSPSGLSNRILAAMPAEEYSRLLPDLEPFPLVLEHVLYAPGEEMTHVYFPERGVISLVTVMREGQEVEAATIGNEGMAGLPAFFGQTIATARWIVQVADGSHRVPRRTFLDHVESMPELQRLLGVYAGQLLDQVAQSAACNAVHGLPERCARWLLMAHDRMQGDNFHLTQEFLSQMLGVYRPRVTMAARTLQTAGLITYRRGDVQIIDREGLEDASCECYQATRERFAGTY